MGSVERACGCRGVTTRSRSAVVMGGLGGDAHRIFDTKLQARCLVALWGVFVGGCSYY
jgi:hypothetical protein